MGSSLESGFMVALPRLSWAWWEVAFLPALLKCWLHYNPHLSLLLGSRAGFPVVPTTDKYNRGSLSLAWETNGIGKSATPVSDQCPCASRFSMLMCHLMYKNIGHEMLARL